MPRLRLGHYALVVVFASTLAPAGANAQPALESLWPHTDGLVWEYGMHITDITGLDWTGAGTLRFNGVVETPGGPAQVLEASHPTPANKSAPSTADPILAAVWRARPDLRAAIAARYGDVVAGGPDWYPLLLHGGYFQSTANALLMWQDKWDYPTWTFATSNLTVGAMFTHQLVPDLADNIFLHGTVEAIDATVMTPAGTFTNAVRMGYLIDYGWNEDVFQPGCSYRAETFGRVHFVPGTGPVELHEGFIPYVEIDCGANPVPPEWEDLLGVTAATIDMALTRTTVGIQRHTFSQVKSLYR